MKGIVFNLCVHMYYIHLYTHTHMHTHLHTHTHTHTHTHLCIYSIHTRDGCISGQKYIHKEIQRTSIALSSITVSSIVSCYRSCTYCIVKYTAQKEKRNSNLELRIYTLLWVSAIGSGWICSKRHYSQLTHSSLLSNRWPNASTVLGGGS